MQKEIVLPKDWSIPKKFECKYIDLGLPSGTLWADRNVGAEEWEDFGDYLTFGEALKYNLPTFKQIEELHHKCTWKWGILNKNSGYFVIGNNGNSIFLPAAGYRYNTSLYDAGSYGRYWSRSLNSNYLGNAYYLSFVSGYVYWDSDYYRSYGFSVRPVKTK